MSEQSKADLQGRWSSSWVFILAAAGSAVGLGNIWKFPYIAGENGGAAFVLVYLLFIIAIGIPVLMAELLLGRRGRHNPPDAVTALAKEAKRSAGWQIAGWFGLIAGFLILSYYVVIAGWAVDYSLKSMAGVFTGASPSFVQHYFQQLTANPYRLLVWSTLLLVITMFIIARGLKKGLEVAVHLMFPAMVVLLLILVGYSMGSGYFIQGAHFLFTPDFSRLTAESVLSALGHALFTLSVGTGAIMMYGAYLPKGISIARVSVIVAVTDTFIALLAGLAIFPIVFANDLTPSAGPGLIFQTLPLAFGQMPYGALFATLFFLMIVFAALTSAISLIEATVTWLIENTRLTRVKAAISCCVVLWFLSLGTVFSFNEWEHIKFFGLTFFDSLDYLTANIMLPLGALLISLFVGWRMKKAHILEELQLDSNSGKVFFNLWLFALRFIVPAGIVLVFLKVIGLL